MNSEHFSLNVKVKNLLDAKFNREDEVRANQQKVRDEEHQVKVAEFKSQLQADIIKRRNHI